MTSVQRHELRYQRRRAKRLAKIIERAKQYTDWDSVFGLDALIDGYKKVAKASMDKTSTQTWLSNLACNARKEQIRLANGTWKSPGVNCFQIKERGKWRDIQSSKISEKGIQNSFSNNCLIPIARPHLIYDNGASLKGGGTDFSLNRFTEHFIAHLRKHGVVGGIYFFDFKSFFALICQAQLIGEVGKYIQDERIMEIFKMFTCAYGAVGIGLGSQVSQISALVYPNQVDHFIKDQLGIEGYGRHMDDGYIICSDIEKLKEIARLFEEKCEALHIVMNRKKCRIIKIGKPFVFLKTRFLIKDTGKIVKRIGREVAKKERKRLRKFRKFCDDGIMTAHEVYLNFHSWVMAQTRCKSFNHLLNMIRYYNELFQENGKYEPTKLNKRKYRVVNYIARIA